jgi:NADP-dependent 3-hydroxy acid dehydrogenase YdfG
MTDTTGKSGNQPLAGKVAVVTGASSGIGRAISLALSRQQVSLCLLGRNGHTLADTVAMAQQFTKVTSFQLDLTQGSFQPLVHHLDSENGKLDILIHCAGAIKQGTMDSSRAEDFDLQYAVNVRAPYVLTQSLLPMLTTSRGQIVFVNSSVGLAVRRAEVGQYAATKHALRAVADSLREEVNAKGIRVLSLYLGRTATPMQEALHRSEQKAYRPEILLQPEDIASVVIHTLLLPPTAEVTDINIRPMRKPD